MVTFVNLFYKYEDPGTVPIFDGKINDAVKRIDKLEEQVEDIIRRLDSTALRDEQQETLLKKLEESIRKK